MRRVKLDWISEVWCWVVIVCHTQRTCIYGGRIPTLTNTVEYNY